MVKLATKTKKDELEETVKSMAEKLSKLESAVVVAKPDDSGEKLSQTLKDIKNKSTPVDKSHEGHSHSTEEIDCPSCGKDDKDKPGHKGHKLHSDGKGGLLCTRPDCKQEFIMIPKAHAEYVCETCGQAHAKIDTRNKEIAKNDVCINCGKDSFVPKGYKIGNK